jgi:hypothetical protein
VHRFAVSLGDVNLFRCWLFNYPQHERKQTMQFRTIVLATALALSTSVAFAQAGGGNAAGASVPENSGTAVNGQGGAVGTVDNGRMTRSPEGTTGMSQSGPRTDGGGRDVSRPGGEGVSRKPAD